MTDRRELGFRDWVGQFTKRACEALGIQFDLRLVGQANDASVALGEGVEEAIVEANNDDDVGGVMVRLRLLPPFLSGELGELTRRVPSVHVSTGLLSHLRRNAGSVPPASRLAPQGRRGPQPPVPLQPLPQVRPRSTPFLYLFLKKLTPGLRSERSAASVTSLP